MLWITNHRLLTLSLLSAFVSFSFCLLGLSSDSYATSQVITCTTLSCYNQQIKKTHDSASVGFSFSYVSIEIQSDKLNSSTNIGTILINGSQSSRFCYQNGSGYLYCLFNTDSNYTNNINWSSWMNNDTLPWSYTVTFYDSNPVVPCSCPEPDPCPEVPDTPYGDKLDKIYNAIMIASGTMLVIYFFFAIYSMFFGGLKR